MIYRTPARESVNFSHGGIGMLEISKKPNFCSFSRL